MASSNFVRLLGSWREALDASRTVVVAPPPSAPEAPQKAREKSRAGDAPDSVIRVSRNAVEALTDVLDRSAMSRARRETQLRSLLDLRTLTQEALLWAERAGSELRMLEVQTPMLAGARDRLRDLSAGMKQVSAALWRDLESERIQGAQLKDTLRELRTVPAHTLGELLRRTARDTAGRVGKNVRLELVGGEVRLDRRIVDAVRDPLLHLLRNAVDHGIEAPQTRLQRGKDPEGCLTLSVEQRGGRVVFSLSDDGGGLDLRRIRERALSRGLHDARTLDTMSDAELARLIFLPGFSTAQTVTEVSGRGVGLDVVEALASALGGTVTVEHKHGKGSTFRLELPRALGAVLGLVVKVGSQQLVLPNDAVARLVRLTHRELSVVGGQPMAKIDDELVPFVSLARLLGLPGARLPLEGGDPVVTVVLGAGAGEGRVALGVDELVDHQELVVHGLGKHLKDTKHFAGAAQLNDGTVVPVLQTSELVQLASHSVASTSEARSASILVADDALSTRAAIRSILEIAGFSVLAASDGEEAWELMQSNEVSLLITDLQMPRLDGLGLVRRVRGDARWEQLPVVVVTAADSSDDRSIGLEAGADAYLVKRDIERGALLERVRQLLVVDP
jgi:two-component system chemotaxis sensor kinase CheA